MLLTMLTITGAEHIVIDETTEATGTLHVEAGRIVDHAVHGETLDVTGCVVTPGLVNAHHHLL